MTHLSLPSRIALAAALLCALMLFFFWPGVAMFDSVAQYQQVVSGSYYDWHPPVMARLWSVFHGLGWAGQAPMFVLQMGLYWLGLGMIAAALMRDGKQVAAIAVLALGLWPPFLGWQAAVLKDAQMAGAMLAATGIIGWRRLTGQALRRFDIAAAALLLLYATLVRANAVFAVAPLAAGLFVPWSWRRWPLRFGLIALGTLAVLAISPAINHGLLRAEPSGVEESQPIFDLAGIVHRAGPDAAPLLPREDWQKAEALHCASAVLWDAYSSGERCGFIQDDLDGMSHHQVFAGWIAAIRTHPAAYAAHRIAHWNATMRWFVPWHFPLAIPEAGSEPNTLGLRSPAKAVEPFDTVAGWLVDGPLGAPILALAVALAVLALARPTSGATHALAVPLALSAAAMEASFLVVSISSDWRYHLWSMLAAALSVILLLTRPLAYRGVAIALALVLLVAGSCLAARLALPPVGDGYADVVAGQ